MIGSNLSLHPTGTSWKSSLRIWPQNPRGPLANQGASVFRYANWGRFKEYREAVRRHRRNQQPERELEPQGQEPYQQG